MDEGSLGVHEIELVIDSGEDLSDGSGVGDHAAAVSYTHLTLPTKA